MKIPASFLLPLLLAPFVAKPQMVGQVLSTNAFVRVMAANLSSGNNQRYETPGQNILRGLKPDIVAMQEFNVSNSFGINTSQALSNLVATTFGVEFVFFRESGYVLPNGIVSRHPILASGSWEDHDTGVNDRGFAWARIDLPGTNDLYVVSVHLKASSGAANETRRGAEAAELKDLITTNFPPQAWVVLAGDLNLYSETEAAITTFKTFLSDAPVPADQKGGTNTNAGRSERYDRVLPSFSLTNTLAPLVLPSRTYTSGLVFDSRMYTPLSEVAPVELNDSGAVNMQHMAVTKVFNVPYAVTNPPPVPFELTGLSLSANGVFQLGFTNTPGALFTVLAATNPSLPLSNWTQVGGAIEVSPGQFRVTDPQASNQPQRFFRVRAP